MNKGKITLDNRLLRAGCIFYSFPCLFFETYRGIAFFRIAIHSDLVLSYYFNRLMWIISDIHLYFFVNSKKFRTFYVHFQNWNCFQIHALILFQCMCGRIFHGKPDPDLLNNDVHNEVIKRFLQPMRIVEERVASSTLLIWPLHRSLTFQNSHPRKCVFRKGVYFNGSWCVNA